MRTGILWITFLAVFACFCVGAPAYAREPKSLFERPVKVDETGQPLYNSFQRYEYQRRLREQKQRQTPPSQVSSSPGSVPGERPVQNGADSEPTPLSVIINRPVIIQGDPNGAVGY